MNFYQSRIKTLTQLLPAEHLDACLVTDPINLRYYLGQSNPFGMLLVSAKKCVFFDTTEGDSPKSQVDVVEVQRCSASQESVALLAKQLTALGIKSLGVEASHLSWAQATDLIEQLPKVAVQPMKTTVERLRALKDPGEVEVIRAANDLAARGWRMLGVMLTETETESQLAQLVEQYVRRIGGRLAGGDPVRLGLNTGTRGEESEPVGEVSKLVYDVSVVKAYHARLERSMKTPFAVSPSRKNKRERLAYNFDAVLGAAVAAQTAAVATLREGATAADVYGACRESVEKAGFAAALDPLVGHGVGLQPIEHPLIRPGSTEPLQSGMVIHVGVRLSFPEWGGVSVGDDFVVRGNQAFRLSATAREVPPGPGL